ncbi:MAG: P-type conjugative transfer protein TrbL [Novosphingobium sp.]
MKRLLASAAVLLLFVWIGTGDAFAQANLAAPDQSVQGLLDIIQSRSASWDASLRGYASSIFWSLAIIQFVITFFPLAIRNGDFSEIVGELVRFILVIGFFAALLLYSTEWARAIVDSFREAGGVASGLGRGLRPGDMFGTAVELAKTINDVETWNPGTAIAIAASALVVLVCFAFIAAFMFVTLVESYIVINASVLFMGFGGSQWTRDYALALLRYAVAVGAKLFVLTLIVGIVLQSAKEWQAAYSHDDASMLTMVGLALVCAYLSKTIPDLIQGLISGVSPSGGGTIGSMAAVAAVGTAAGVAALASGGAAAAGGAGAAGGGLGGAGGAAGGAGGAAGGSGGLAGLLNSSLMGAGRAPATSGMSEGVSAAARTAGQRTGGGASASPSRTGGASAAPQMAQQAANDAGKGEGQGSAQEAQSADAAAPADAAQGDGGGSVGASSPPSGGGGAIEPGQAPSATSATASAAGPAAATGSTKPGMARTATAGLVRTTGLLSALTVPGMEGAAGLSIGPHIPSATGSGDNASDGPSDFAQSDNVIAPASEPSSPPVNQPPADQPPSDPPKGGDA